MSRSPAEILATHRAAVAATLVDSRATVDDVYHELGNEQLHDHVELLLGKLHGYLVDDDADALAAYVRRWVAVRVGAGARHENLIPALVAVGDAVVEVAQERDGDTDEIRELMRRMIRASLIAARVVVEVLADEFERRREQIDGVLGGRR